MIKKILKNPRAMIGIIIISTLAVLAIFAPIIAPNNPQEIDILTKFAQPSDKYPLGTDELGRCVLSRLIYGTRYSIGVAIPIVLVVGLISVVLGTLAAYYGGIVDRVFVVLMDIVMAFPPLVIILALIGSLGQSLTNLFLSMIIALWTWYGKIVRSYVLQEKKKDYITAAKISESSDFKILVKHIIPNVIPILLVNFTIGIGSVIVMISGFSYLGLGVGAGVPEWGAMLSNAKQYFYSNPQFIIYPGVCILITVTGFNLLGEAIRDIITPEEII